MTLSPSPRRAYALLETLGAAVLLTVAMALTVQLLGWSLATRRANERRRWAIQEVANVMDRLSSMPWETLSSSTLPTQPLSSSSKSILPDATLKVLTHDEDNLKRLTVELRWKESSRGDGPSVRLTSWITREGRQIP